MIPDILIYILHQFTQNMYLKRRLLATEGRVLAEASPYDDIWGIGLRCSDENASQERTWRGANWLGYILTKVSLLILDG